PWGRRQDAGRACAWRRHRCRSRRSASGRRRRSSLASALLVTRAQLLRPRLRHSPSLDSEPTTFSVRPRGGQRQFHLLRSSLLQVMTSAYRGSAGDCAVGSRALAASSKCPEHPPSHGTTIVYGVDMRSSSDVHNAYVRSFQALSWSVAAAYLGQAV